MMQWMSQHKFHSEKFVSKGYQDLWQHKCHEYDVGLMGKHMIENLLIFRPN